MKHHRIGVGLIALAVVAAAAGCTSSEADNDGRPAVTRGALVGTWSVKQEFGTPEQPFVSFAQNNTWIGSDGCDRVNGSWTLAASGRFAVHTNPHLDLACDGRSLPAAVIEASRISVVGSVMTIRSSLDSTVTTLNRSSDKDIGPQGRPIGYWVAGKTPASPYLALRADGSYRLYDGCVTATGTWISSADSQLRFTAAAPTTASCTGIDQWLLPVTRARVSGDTMTLFTGTKEIGQLSEF